MRYELKSRGKIIEEIKRRGRTIDEYAGKLETVGSENKALSEASRNLRLSTTLEGAETVRQCLVEAFSLVGENFKKLYVNLGSKLADAHRATSELRFRARDARRNASAVRSAAEHTRGTKHARAHLDVGHAGATKEADDLDRYVAQSAAETQAAEKARAAQGSTIENTVVDFDKPVKHDSPRDKNIARDRGGNYGPTKVFGEKYKLKPSGKTEGRRTDSGPMTKCDVPPEELERRLGLQPSPAKDEERKPRRDGYRPNHTTYKIGPGPYDIGPKPYDGGARPHDGGEQPENGGGYRR